MTRTRPDMAEPDGIGRAPLHAALAGSLVSRLRLPGSLEAAYQARRRAIAVANIRAHWGLVALAIAAIAVVTFSTGLADGGLYGVVVFGFAAVFAAVGIVAAGALIPAWHPHIDRLLAVATFVALAGMLGGTQVAPAGSALRSIAEYGVIFITIAACTISGMSLARAFLVVTAANVTFLLASTLSLAYPGSLDGLGLPAAFAGVLDGFTPDWARFPYYAGGSGVIAALMGLSQEVRERTVFLQERLLVLEKRELDQLTGELTLISRQDALTGLANRRHFDEVFAREWSACQREGTSMNLFFIDVDHFKRYNDHYGHQAGDACLARVGAALATQAKRGADFVARYGGEEFVAFFPRTNAVGLRAIAERMVEAIDALAIPHAASDVGPSVTISVGFAVLTPVPGQGGEVLLKAADAALYRAKQAGRHRYEADDGNHQCPSQSD